MAVARARFGAIGASVTADEFRLSTASDTGQAKFYDQASGRLFYDASPFDATLPVHFAMFGAGTLLLASDIVVV